MNQPLARMPLQHLGLLGLTLSFMAGLAKAYPTRAVRLVVPFAAGGSNETVAKVIAQRLSASFGQQVYVDNRSGAGGMVGAEAAAKSPPDGYTLFLGGVASLAVHAVAQARVEEWRDAILALETMPIARRIADLMVQG